MTKSNGHELGTSSQDCIGCWNSSEVRNPNPFSKEKQVFYNPIESRDMKNVDSLPMESWKQLSSPDSDALEADTDPEKFKLKVPLFLWLLQISRMCQHFGILSLA